jgi:hypothetical protein
MLQRQVDRQQVVERVLVLDTIESSEHDSPFGLLSCAVGVVQFRP